MDTGMCVLSPVMVLISPCGVPSCLTPMAQHFCAGWDAMLELLCMLGVSKKKKTNSKDRLWSMLNKVVALRPHYINTAETRHGVRMLGTEA